MASTRRVIPLLLVLAATLAGCARPVRPPPVVPLAQAPPFMRQGYEPYSRAAAVAVALREWRAWGSPVNDDPPGTRAPRQGEDKPERQDGMWQRVGEYWWLGIDATRPEAGWTGRHDAGGFAFPASADGAHPWSAAFIGYVLYSAGAGTRFTGAPAHASYINGAVFGTSSDALRAHALDAHAPQPGDLVCHARQSRAPMRLASLTGALFPSHCDIVVASDPGSISVIGGNVDDAVTLKHLPTDGQGRIGDGDGRPYDTRYPWFVVLQVLYDR